MSIEKFLEPMEIEIEDRKFVISKFPAIAGRKIVTQYISSGVPKIGNYNTNEEMMLNIMKYVARIDDNGNKIVLSNQDLIDNHVVSKSSSWEMLVKLEGKMLEYNCDFFQNGRISNFFGDIAQKLPQWIIKILKDSSVLSSRQDTQPTES
jgi:hypothetical protein